jgi:peroxiredoxin
MKKALLASAVAAACVVGIRGTSEAQPPAGIGEEAKDFTLRDTEGKERSLSGWKDSKAVVVAFLGTQCPISNRCLPELAAISSGYAERGVAVLGVNSNRNEQGEVAAHAKERAVPFPVLLDGEQSAADMFGIQITPTVVVLDGSRRVRYRGRVDDDPMGGRPKSRDLRLALDSVLAGEEVATPETTPRGCVLRRGEAAADGKVTYARDVAPILNSHCVECHRRGQIGPMTLTDFEHASAFSREIKAAVQAKRMPPWKPTGGLAFRGERKLTDAEIATLVEWADSDTPRGNEKDLPPAPKFAEGWRLGQPDLVLSMPEDFELAADGAPDVYMHFVLPTDLPEDTWISGTEIRAGNARIVHHVIAYVDTSGAAEKLDERAPGQGYPGEGTWPGFIPTGEMGGWAPGNSPRMLPDGVGRMLKKGARVVLQVHYNKCGTPQKDRTQIGLFFCKTPVRQQLRWAEMVNAWFEIPPGATDHAVRTQWKAREDVTVLDITPHQHLLGKSAKATAITPDGENIELIRIDAWDFKWQDSYELKEPLKLKKGSKINYLATYDNSEGNPNNPHRPPVTVRWGEKTSDEMCLCYVAYVADGEDLTKPPKKNDSEEDEGDEDDE